MAHEVSKGQTELTRLTELVFPNEIIVNEYQLGEQLRLDIFCQGYRVGLEYHGVQHFNFVAHFHKTYENFCRAQERDMRKIELCAEQGISLAFFNYDEKLTEELVYDRVMEAIQSDIGPKADVYQKPKKTNSIKGNPIYERIKEEKKARSREFNAKLREERQRLRRLNK